MPQLLPSVFKSKPLVVVVVEYLMSKLHNIVLILAASFLSSSRFISSTELGDEVIDPMPLLLVVGCLSLFAASNQRTCQKVSSYPFQKPVDFCSLPTTGSLFVFNHELIRTTSSVGVHFRHSLRSATLSPSNFEASVPTLPRNGTCDEDSSTLSSKLPKETIC